MEPVKARAKLLGDWTRMVGRHEFEALDRVKGLNYSAIKPLVSIQNAPPQPIGTGVLLRIDPNVFLLTAAHAIENFDSFKLHIPYEDKWIPVGGKSYRTPKPVSGTHLHDPLDAAVMVIDGEARNLLRNDALTMDDIYLHDGVLDYGLVVMGYPLKRFKRTGMVMDWRMARATFDAEPKSTYSRLHYSPQDHILMKWRRKIFRQGSADGPVASPSLVGMSGGPVWVIPGFRRPDFSADLPFLMPKLVGIFIERRRHLGVVVAATLSYHMSLISRHHPEFDATIQQDVDEQAIAKLEGRRKFFPILREIGVKPMPDYLIEGSGPRWAACYVPTGMIIEVCRERSAFGSWLYFSQIKYEGQESRSTHEIKQIEVEAIQQVRLRTRSQ